MSKGTNDREVAALERELAHAHEALARLRQSQALLLSTLDATSDGICTLQFSGDEFFYNIRFVELWGIPEDKLSDMDAEALLQFQLTQVKDTQGWLTLVRQRQNHPDEEDLSLVELKDGRVLERHVLPQRMGGRAVGSVIVFRDVTERRRQEEEIRRARDIAEEATRMKSDFLANMSHEIRTPMNAIIGLSHLVLKTSLTARQRDYIQKVQTSGQHLLGIINDILDFSKVEAGKLELDNTEFALETLLDHISSLISEKCHAKGLELVFDVAPDVPRHLVGDALRLGQVLLNYVNNAVKFTEQGDIVIAVRASEVDAASAMLHFRVQDTGIGLTTEQRNRLFQSFTQGDASTTRKFGGTGLGLAICKRLVGLMGGEVGVDSEYGKGSTFWFSTRLGVAAGAGQEPAPKLDVRGRRVLIVDDNEHARAAIADMLQGMTFATTQVADGATAVEEVRRAAAQGRPYEVVYLDWRMAGMDGLEAARRIRALELPTPPLLLMVTAYGREETVREAAQSGIAGVLVKPVSPSALFDATVRVLGASRAPAPRPSASPTANPALSAVRGAWVLLVEDNDINQQVARELLQDTGLHVDVADNGRVALAMLEQARYDLVFMDMQMPEMDGLEATRALRRNPRFANLPVVAMTANAMEEDRLACIEAGMNDFLLKPIDPEALSAVVLQWIPVRPVAPPAVRHPGFDLPENITGLDTAVGLRNMAGKHGLYMAILRRYVNSQREAGQQIRHAIGAGDGATAHRLAHTLKGVSASIGAIHVQQAAEAMQLAIRNREPVEALQMRLVQLELPLDALIAALEAQLGPADGPPPGYRDMAHVAG